MAEPNCLPMCSCCTRSPPHSKPFRRCGGCKVRTYCERKCQLLDWKFCYHRSFCKKSGDEHVNSNTHQPRCAYLDHDPEIEDTCMVETGRVKTNPRELITTRLNACIFVVLKLGHKWLAGMPPLLVRWDQRRPCSDRFGRRTLWVVLLFQEKTGLEVP